MDKGRDVQKPDGMEGFKTMMLRVMKTNEVRCPKCGKLLLKGGFSRGSWLDLRCTNNKCTYHKEKLMVVFQ